MATQIKSNKTYQGDAAALPSPQAPMPKLASLYRTLRKSFILPSAEQQVMQFAPAVWLTW
ncbi:hypothetical protein [Klebsiella quasipneumoniae]|uniref:hypothetical protein n=1 Tax=Klebsiella quasipneumoniae TaxID=1463165 RepID=UPI00388F0A45